MPFDGTNFQQTFSLVDMIAWLERQPADVEYCWSDAETCVWAQYGQYALDLADGRRAYSTITEMARDAIKHNYAKISLLRPHTYGAALDRAREVLAAQSFP